MITFEELETYTPEELTQLLDWVRTLNYKGTTTLEEFFNYFVTLDTVEEINTTFLFDSYVDWIGNNNKKELLDKKTFIRLAIPYVTKHNITLARVKKIKAEKQTMQGDIVSTKQQ